MNAKEKSREWVERELGICESRLHELVKSGKGGEHSGDLASVSEELKSCRLELNKVQNRSDDKWDAAKHGVVRRLNEAKESLGLSVRKMI